MNHVINQHRSRGFTLVELMLAMTFIAFLLVAIAMTILQITSIYNHGITVKEVDQTGQAIVSDFQNTISQSAPFPAVANAAGSYYINTANLGGRLCTGQYSYIWNYGTAVASSNPSRNMYSGAASGTMIRLVRVPDVGANYCLSATTTSKTISASNAVELLNTGDHDIAIQSFTLEAPTTAGDVLTHQQLYGIQFTIGTNEQTALLISGGNISCKAPGQTGSDPDYCAVNNFDIVARAGNAG